VSAGDITGVALTVGFIFIFVGIVWLLIRR
jgi:hypothetical protein